MAYKVRVYGTYADEMIDDTVIINPNNKEVITSSPNTCTLASTLNRTATDELGNSVTFPVVPSYGFSFKNGRIVFNVTRVTMRDRSTPEVIVYSGDLDHLVTKSAADSNSWDDCASHISAYMNMRDILAWWKNTFGQKSVDNKNTAVKVVVNASDWSDNAASYYSPKNDSSVESIRVGTLGNRSEFDHTRAIGRDTLTHETGHSVLNYTTGGLTYNNATGAIHDGYADIFGCLRDQDWKHGWRVDPTGASSGITYFIDKTQCLRDATEDVTIANLSTGSRAGITTAEELYELYDSGRSTGDGNGCHTYCRLVTHAAYLMHQDGVSKLGLVKNSGLTWYQLGRVWYKSMSMGLDDTSDFHTVRRNVIRAARQCGLGNHKILAIKKAFDAIGIYEARGTLRGTVEGFNYNATRSSVSNVNNANIILSSIESGYSEASTTSNRSGYYEVSADSGVYNVKFLGQTSSGTAYKTLTVRQYVPVNDTIELDVILVESGTGNLNIRIVDSNGNGINGVTFYLLEGWNNIALSSSSITGTTNSAGQYTFNNLASGYYTLLARKNSGTPQYPDHRFNITVYPNSTINYAKALFAEVKDRYVAWLSYDDGYSNLEPNLESRIWSYPSPYLLNITNRTSVLENGREFAVYHSYSSIKQKSVVFVSFYKSKYAYYIDWGDATTPDWNNAGARVDLYYGGKYVTSFTPPKGAGTGRYWHVFNVNNGVRKPVNEILETRPVAE